jgi:hypothetical protein
MLLLAQLMPSAGKWRRWYTDEEDAKAQKE